MIDPVKRGLKLQLEELFRNYGLSVGVGLTKEGVAIRSQDERVDAANIGEVRALEQAD
jgi:hypothetical protein